MFKNRILCVLVPVCICSQTEHVQQRWGGSSHQDAVPIIYRRADSASALPALYLSSSPRSCTCGRRRCYYSRCCCAPGPCSPPAAPRSSSCSVSGAEQGRGSQPPMLFVSFTSNHQSSLSRNELSDFSSFQCSQRFAEFLYKGVRVVRPHRYTF